MTDQEKGGEESTRRADPPPPEDRAPESNGPCPGKMAGPDAEGFAGHMVDRRDALVVAIGLHRRGSLDDAETIYRRVLAVEPQDPDALHYLGVLCHQRGRSGDAIALIMRAIDIAPDYFDAHNNLGNVFQAAGRTEEAAGAYRRALELRPEDALALNNLATVLRGLGQLEAAIAAHRRAIELEPRFTEAHLALGKALRDTGNPDGAIDAFRKAIDLDPKYERAYQSLGWMLYRAGRHAEAAGVFEGWVAQDPGNPMALHMRAACSGGDVPARASDGFVQKVFDALAPTFDNHLRGLQYRAPQLVTNALAAMVGAPLGDLDVLDAGCGTGLCGAELRPYARRLVGVDLSRGMLDKARGRDVYDELVVAELTAYLGAHRGAFDVIVSADTLVYFGKLGPAFAAAAGALRNRGHLVFTVESTDLGDETAEAGYRLNPSGRYSHHQGYVRDRLAASGLMVVSVMGATLRKEAGSPVAGYVVTATKA